MSAAPPKDQDQLPEHEAEERFNRLVGNLVKTPHKPHYVKEQPEPPESPKSR